MNRIANRYNHGLTENDVTDSRLFRERRKFIRNSIAGGTGLALASYFPVLATAAVAGLADKIRGAEKTRSLEEGDELNSLDQITQYNNFYELGTGKEDPATFADALKTDPWSVRIDGECGKPGTYTLEDILKPHDLEERIYRLRCVEAWSMVIPWIGFSLGDLLKRFEPSSKAKYVAFETIYDRGNLLPGQRRQSIEWPYREGLRMDEAMHPLTMAVVGLYGEILPNQNGAPLRLVVPWKYGYKSIKSIVKISFVEKEPPTSWNMAIPHEYGFYSNVNPAVDHPRWSQATERRIGEFFKRDTLVLNGYPEAASLYGGDLADYF